MHRSVPRYRSRVQAPATTSWPAALVRPRGRRWRRASWPAAISAGPPTSGRAWRLCCPSRLAWPPSRVHAVRRIGAFDFQRCFRRHNGRDCHGNLIAFAGPGRGPDANGAIERRERAAKCDRTAIRRPTVLPAHMARPVHGARGCGRADYHRRLQRVCHGAPAGGRASACADGLLRSCRLRRPAFRRVDIQGADRSSEFQCLALIQGLDQGRGRPPTRASAIANAPPRASSPAPALADAHTRADGDGPLAALARSDSHLVAAAVAPTQLAADSRLAAAGSPPLEMTEHACCRRLERVAREASPG